MAAHPIAIVHDGIVHIPDELRNDPCFQNGAQLQLVPLQPPIMKKESGDWKRLRGALAHIDINLNEELDRERQRDNVRDESILRGTRA